MSATFKNARKKASQEQLRKLMKEHQKGLKEVKKIESPLAKYNDLGQLTCILCKSVVRSEAVWTVHINAKQHKQNVEMAKKLKEKTNNFTTPLKRPLTPPLPEVPEKKIKGILKNAITPVTTKDSGTSIQTSKENGNGIPSDFFDNTSKTTTKNPVFSRPIKSNTISGNSTEEPEHMEEEIPEELPEGFFDDPKLDAKARHIEYKDPAEEEWDRFMKEIKEADNKSAAIIAEDQEEATTERQIDEIDEQLKKLNRVLALEKQKDEIVTVLNDVKNENIDDDDDADVDFDEFLDWRAKKSFK
ncbi:zinc finger protein 830 [Sitophilus oryzae]|uniref:Zinc finger protein 830 n=1 Tax=Sitophilus oryzae TaxID=7048 RepID=A0A6J2Y2R5_SITOR|nr:zinc finger protein 830 [Sitophilus oryzae]